MCVRTSIAWHCAVARGMSSSSGSLECELPFRVFPDNKVKSKNKWGEMLRDVTFLPHFRPTFFFLSFSLVTFLIFITFFLHL